jgi:basic amino acid/polyamine antiporter, APA family
MPGLARKLSLWNYFALGFGTMIGTGWVVVINDWLGRGGSLGAMLGFAIGGVLLLPVSYVYGEWVKRLPDASGEAAYTAQVFPPFISYITGWIMFLAYFIVCPWEAVAVGKLVAFLFPRLDTWELYRVAGQPVFLPRLVLGAALTLFLAWLNYRGIRASATFQNWTTTTLLVVFLFLIVVSGHSGQAVNLKPYFSHAPLVSILLTLQIVPYFITGFESVPKVAEEAHPGFPPGDFYKAIAMALLLGASFYFLALGMVSYLVPWQSIVGQRFATAIAFEQGAHSWWISRLVLAVTFVGLLQVFNGNFVAASRLLFAYGRRGTVPRVFAKIDARHLTPSLAIAGITFATLVGLLVGDALLVPVTEVGSMASAFGWLAACVSLYAVERRPNLRIVSALGIVVSLSLVLMKFIPEIPGHFTTAEWIALAAWLAIGFLMHVRAQPAQ